MCCLSNIGPYLGLPAKIRAKMVEISAINNQNLGTIVRINLAVETKLTKGVSISSNRCIHFSISIYDYTLFHCKSQITSPLIRVVAFAFSLPYARRSLLPKHIGIDYVHSDTIVGVGRR